MNPVFNAKTQRRKDSLAQRMQRLVPRNVVADFLCGLCENLCDLCVKSHGMGVWLQLGRHLTLRFTRLALRP
jgi:hypothetical protein